MSILTLLIIFLGALFKSQRQLVLEKLALRQQVTMLRQSVKRPRATAADKLFCSKRDVNKRKEGTKHPNALDDPSPGHPPQGLAGLVNWAVPWPSLWHFSLSLSL